MIAVLFEVWIDDAASKDEYLAVARSLADDLASIEGFVSIERFHSLADASKMLSLSYWRDEAAVARWRAWDKHRAAQRLGRERLFRDYRIRVANVVRAYGMRE